MCILKALDQTQIEDKKDRELQKSLFQGHKQRRKQEMMRNWQRKGPVEKLDPNLVIAADDLSNIVQSNSNLAVDESNTNPT